MTPHLNEEAGLERERERDPERQMHSEKGLNETKETIEIRKTTRHDYVLQRARDRTSWEEPQGRRDASLGIF